MTVQRRSLEAKNTREEIQNTKSERKKRGGGEDLHRLFFLLITGFSYYFDWLKILLLFFLTFGLKKYFSPFSTNDCDLILHIMLVLGYYHSMILRGDQSLYEVITIAQRLLLADMPLDPCVIQEFSWGAVK